MVEYQTGRLSEKNRIVVENILNSLTDSFSDFYITQNNLRLFLKENQDILFDSLEKGNKLFWDSTRGIIFVTGYHDKSPRKYVKILAKDEKSAEDLIKVLFWHTKENLYAKLKKNNPIRRVLQKNQFKFAGDRGREILLMKRYITREDLKIDKKREVENNVK